jgi:hypothetical protein
VVEQGAMRRLSIALSEEVVLALVARSEQTGLPLTQLVQAAVQAYLAGPRRRGKPGASAKRPTAGVGG